ncbi:MAG: nucleotidyl transferase AbiEii/AbiGii toxin family protein [Caldisericaceae bacterium]
MIKDTELKSTAAKYKVGLSKVERDYAQSWLLKHLNQINMALKGGTGLRKVYFSEYRFSDDLDFTLLEDTDKNTLSRNIDNAVRNAKEESGINFLGLTNTKETKTGYKFEIGFMISQTMNIQLDITEYSKEIVLLPVIERKINHIFSDNLNGTAKSYDIKEILAEKVRTIFERGFPRDLYDVGYLILHGIEIDKELLENKFKQRNVKMSFSQLELQKEKMRNAWITSLDSQINPVPDFESFFKLVSERLQKI